MRNDELRPQTDIRKFKDLTKSHGTEAGGCCSVGSGDESARPENPRNQEQPNEDAVTTAREIMTGGAECVGEKETLEQAARKMKDLDVGSLPI